MSFVVRRWEENDSKDVAELEKACFSDPWSEAMVESSFSMETFFGFVAEEEGKVVGYVGASSVFDTADILLIASSPSFRRKGAAKALLNAVEKEAAERGADRIMLEVDESNDAAINLYLSIGFKTIAERKDYYGAGKHAYIMEKMLLNDL